jgi:hypothetical protein
MTESGTPIAYSALGKGVPVVSRSGHQFGVVEHVLQIPEEDLFDGIVVSAHHGVRFVNSNQVDTITTTKVTTTLSDDETAKLPAPAAPPAYEADPLADSSDSLHDRFGRMFKRPRWTTID